MADLGSFTEEQLVQELEARKPARTLKPPVPLEKPDFTGLIATVTSGVEETIKNKYEDDDLRSYIYEAAITALYGQDYWTWRRQQKW